MRQLLSGVVLAGTLVISAPVWAQTSAPMNRSTPTVPAAGTATPMNSAEACKAKPRRTSTGKRSRRGVGPSDNVANQRKAQELARMGGGLPPAGMGGPPRY